ncbi:hypothetical protein KY290_037171 [Solanum tuberosum]|uniref:TTF-type domain-containing protein n=1 Tax=Solanum tuberosum TaxID=4113 RepID=A0ABQ7TWH0_SOLTU|nr:hypothetical protein KY290_037171 [Solanum tuberosum]
MLSHSSQKQSIDLNTLEVDPAKGTSILNHDPNLRDEIRRAYLKLGPCRPNITEYPQSYIAKAMRRFNSDWYKAYDWLEYSESADATYCLPCYLFKGNNIHQGGGEVFSTTGFNNWHKKSKFDEHVGGPNSVHNQAKRKCDDLMQQRQSVRAAFDKQSDQIKLEYWTRLNASIDVIRLLLN